MLPLPANVLGDLSELEAATNERKIAEAGGNPGTGPAELFYGVAESDIVNAAFPTQVLTEAASTVRAGAPGMRVSKSKPPSRR